jgi:EAL domain-containing protein (putative c-di-GMP-specific phosphodiesterase class I)
MYRAKRDGRNAYRFFTSEMQAQSARALQLENALRRALERQQLSLHYQPQLALEADGEARIVGAEALLRWQHPELGWVSPAEFIPIAEATGLILPIGEWVLREALSQLSRWDDAGLPELTMAVNLSAVQFRHDGLPELVGRLLAELGMAPGRLELELTEGAAMDNPAVAITVMNELHARGVRLSIDDFGTGYSSLSYLKKFRVSKLKIDQSFVRDLTEDAEDRAIVDAVIRMAGALGLETLAEGVETEGQLAFLRRQGCQAVQGYLFSRPLPAATFVEFVLSGQVVSA